MVVKQPNIHNEDVVGELITEDGKVFLRKSIPETFDIARKMLEICRQRLEKEEKELKK